MTPWEELAGELLALTHRFDELLEGNEDLRALIRQAALQAYAQHQAQNPAVQAAVADAEWRIESGEGFPDAVPAEEALARIRAMLEETRRHQPATKNPPGL